MAFDIELYNKDFWKQKPSEIDRWVEIFEEMVIHTRGHTPEKLLETRRPNEDENVFTYRKSIYQPITKGPINRSIHKLFRIFQNANFSYKITDSLQADIDEPDFNGMTFNEYMHGVVVKRMIEDPNGYLAWIPVGEGLRDETEKVIVVPELIESGKIQHRDDEVLTWFIHADSNGIVERFWSLTKDAYYVHVKDDDEYELFLIYEHEIGIIPAVILGGMWEDDVFQSYFSAFLPFGNEAIRQYSDWQAVNVTSAFPYRTEKYTECDVPECGGKGWWMEAPKDCDNCDDVRVTCDICKGAGHKPHTSPYGVFIRKERDIAEDEDTGPMVEFTSPATDILKYSQEAWESLLMQAREAIFDKQVDEAQSGVAKIVDRGDFYAWLINISNNIFDHLILKSLEIIQGYRDISATELPVVIKPTSFEVKTEQDIVEELGILIEKKVPAPFILEVTKDLTKKRFSNDPKTSALIAFLTIYDPLFALVPEEKAVLTASGVISDKERAKNVNSYQAINELLIDDPLLFEKSYEEISKLMDEKLGILDEDVISLVGADGLPLPPGEMDVALEAQAKLKGTVGGVQGLIAVNQAVAEGLMSEASAELLLIEVYGFAPDVAGKLIEKPSAQVVADLKSGEIGK